MNKNIIIVVFLIIILISLLFLHNKQECYDSGEHVISANGDKKLKYNGIILKFPDFIIDATDKPLKLPNRLLLNFGQILALAGDIFGDPDLPISSGKTLRDRIEIFKRFFNTLGGTEPITIKVDGKKTTVKPKEEINNILKIFNNEISLINSALDSNQKPSQAYADSGYRYDIDFNVATGGGSGFGKVVKDKIEILKLNPPGRYMELAKQNFDHFADQYGAWNAYMAGHTLGMQTASDAKKNNNLELLELAYAYDAFACHFLSDLFASGHLRTPRKGLHTGEGTILSSTWVSELGDYCAKLMHDEDNHNGLNVSNNACRINSPDCARWRSYGDTMLADTVNQENLRMQNKALQRSVDEIWQSYVDGEPVISRVFDLIPDIEIINTNNPLPMFRYYGNKLFRRKADGSGEEPLFSAVKAIIDFKFGKDNNRNKPKQLGEDHKEKEILFSIDPLFK